MPLLQGADQGFALIQGADQWIRASFENTALVSGVVQLAWEDRKEEPPRDRDDERAPAAETPDRGAGLTFDSHCRLYHSLPDTGALERLLWEARDPLTPGRSGPAPTPLFTASTGPMGNFAPVRPPEPLASPRGLAVDADDHLYIALHGARSVLIMDLWSRRILRRVTLPGRPLDLTTDLSSGHRDVLVVTESPAALFRLTALGKPRALPLPGGLAAPFRIAVAPDGGIWLLAGAATEDSELLELNPPYRRLEIPAATDLAFYIPARDRMGNGPVLVVARRSGQNFRRFRPSAGGLEEIPELAARGYDGLGIVATPNQRIAFWSGQGLRYAVADRIRFCTAGRLMGFQLDSGEYQTPWGRLFVDACIPRETDVRVHCIAADELPEGTRFPRRSPANLPDPQIPHDELSPPLPAEFQVPAAGDARGRLHRRVKGSELPWVRRRPGDDFVTHETPATDTRGRYLWVILELSGNGRATPRIRSLRAEHPGHDLLERLPRVLSREDDAARFLGRFLAPLAGLMADLDARARLRHALLDPTSAPAEALPWLAGMFGLVLDERWPEATRRRLIDAVLDLFRFRGTIHGLSRFLAIVTGVEPIIVEHWRMRGGAVIGEPLARGSQAVVGGGLRVGGQLGSSTEAPLAQQSLEDAFATHAHRFTVMLPALLSADTLELAAHVLDLHRPAHTQYQLCTVTAGSRVGRGLHVGLSAVIGRGSGWERIQVGAAALGRDGILGRPLLGTPTDGARLGSDTRVG